MKLLVCGAAGFIGSNFVRYRLANSDDQIVVLDKLTYAGRRENLQDLENDQRFSFVHAAIEDYDAVTAAAAGCDGIVNFAAETHVDRSISQPDAFIETNGRGTYTLLEVAREQELSYLQISTDEVYGSIEVGSFTENSPIEPSSPYSASKAGADLLVQSYHETYGLPTIICRGSNNYGPYQYPEKLIPLMLLNALHGDKLPVYGDGLNVRNWLYVEDFASGIAAALDHGKDGEVYNVGGPDELNNLEVIDYILAATGRDKSLLEFINDRPGHDRRYSLDASKLKTLGWQPSRSFEVGIAQTIEWYQANTSWWEPIRSGDYREYYRQQYGIELSA